ncbi:MAG: hypothetical protein Q4G40_11810, partial [Brachybacterium sp.]|nr:hypothetical protein [Brachybacterium sp.]
MSREMDELRAALNHEADFDYDALVAGAKLRAGRIRRRQTLTRAVAAVVILPTLAGTAYLGGQLMQGQGLLAGPASTDETAVTAPVEETPAPA